MTPAHVYFVVWWFDRFGGMERHVTDLSLALAARGVRVTVFSETPLADSNAFGRKLRAARIEVIAPMPGRSLWKGWRRQAVAGAEAHELSPSMHGLLHAMTRNARTAPPDIVHVHGCRLGQSFVLQWAAANGYPSVYTEHVTIGDWGGPHDADAAATVAGNADAIACVSDYSRTSLARYLPQRRDIVVVHHIIDDPGRPASVIAPTPARPVSILAVGRLAPHKGYAILLEALAQLRGKGIAFSLQIAGDGEQRAALEGLRNTLGLADAVSFLGEVDHSTVSALWQTSDIGVMPSLTEGLPLSIVEAMAEAIPVVASRVGGIPEVVRHDENGLLVAPGDVSALATALVRLITEPGLAPRLAAAARQSFETGNWSAASVSSQMLAIYAVAARSRTAKTDRENFDCQAWAKNQAAQLSQPLQRAAMCVWSLSSFGMMEAFIAEQAIALAQAGVAVTLYVERPVRPFNRYVAALRRAGVRVVAPSLPGFVAQRGWARIHGRGMAPLLRAFARDVALNRPDVIHFHGWRLSCGWLAPVLQFATARGIRTLYTEHADNDGGGPLDAANIAAIAMIDRLSATSPAAAALVSRTVPSRPMLLLRHAGHPGSAESPNAVASGTLRVFALLPPPDRAALESDLAKTLLSLAPAAPTVSPGPQIDDCDAVVLSPEMPEFGAALIEAMAALKPVVICGEQQSSPILHRANGLVVADSPAAALLELAGDPLLARQFALAANRLHRTTGGRMLELLADTRVLYHSEACGDARG